MEAVASCSGLYSDKRKRERSPEGDLENWIWKRKQTWYYVLGSESEQDTEGPESVHSIQGKSTDCAKDTSDTSTKGTLSDDMIQSDEVTSFSEDDRTFPSDGGFSSDSSSTDVRKHFFPPLSRRKKLCKKRHCGRRNESQSLTVVNNGSGLGSSVLKESSDLCLEPAREVSHNGTGIHETDLCGTCCVCPKDGGYNHGGIVHIYNCYKCSVKILKQRGKCPICNERVRQVVRLVFF